MADNFAVSFSVRVKDEASKTLLGISNAIAGMSQSASGIPAATTNLRDFFGTLNTTTISNIATALSSIDFRAVADNVSTAFSNTLSNKIPQYASTLKGALTDVAQTIEQKIPQALVVAQGSFKTTTNAIVSNVKSGVVDISTALSGVADGVKNIDISGPVNNITASMSTLSDQLSKVDFKGFAKSISTEVGSAFNTITASVSPFAANLSDALKNSINDLSLQGLSSGLSVKFTQVLESAIKSISLSNIISTAMGAIDAGTIIAGTNIASAIQTVKDYIYTLLPVGFKYFGGFIIKREVAGIIDSVVDYVKSFSFSGITQAIADSMTFNEIKSKVMDLTSDIVKSLPSGVMNGLKGLFEQIKGYVSGFKLSDLLSGDMAAGAVNMLKGLAAPITKSFQSLFKDISLSDILSNVFKTIKPIAIDLFKDAKLNLDSLKDAVIKGVSGLVTYLGSKLKDFPVDIVKQVFYAIDWNGVFLAFSQSMTWGFVFLAKEITMNAIKVFKDVPNNVLKRVLAGLTITSLVTSFLPQGTLKEVFSSFTDALGGDLSKAVSGINMGGVSFDKLKDSVSSAFQAIQTFNSYVFEGVRFLSTLTTTLKSFVTSVGFLIRAVTTDMIPQAFNSFNDKLKKIQEGITDTIIKTVTGMGQFIIKHAFLIVDDIVLIIEGAAGVIVKVFTTKVANLLKLSGKVLDATLRVFTPEVYLKAVEGIGSAIENYVLPFAAILSSKIYYNFTTGLGKLNISELILGGNQSLKKDIGTFTSDMSKSFFDAFKTIPVIGNLAPVMQGLTNSFTSIVGKAGKYKETITEAEQTIKQSIATTMGLASATGRVVDQHNKIGDAGLLAEKYTEKIRLATEKENLSMKDVSSAFSEVNSKALGLGLSLDQTLNLTVLTAQAMKKMEISITPEQLGKEALAMLTGGLDEGKNKIASILGLSEGMVHNFRTSGSLWDNLNVMLNTFIAGESGVGVTTKKQLSSVLADIGATAYELTGNISEAWDDLTTSLSQNIARAFTSTFDMLRGFLSEIDNEVGSMDMSAIANSITEPVIQGVKFIISSLKPVYDAVAGVVVKISPVLKALWDSTGVILKEVVGVLSSVIPPLLSSIGSGITAMMGDFNISIIVASIRNMTDFVVSKIQQIKGMVMAMIPGFDLVIREISANIGQLVTEFVKGLPTFIETLKVYLSMKLAIGGVEKIIRGITEAGAKTISTFMLWVEHIKDATALLTNWPNLANAIHMGWKAVVITFSTLWSLLKAYVVALANVTGVVSFFVAWKDGIAVITKVWNGLVDTWRMGLKVLFAGDTMNEWEAGFKIAIKSVLNAFLAIAKLPGIKEMFNPADLVDIQNNVRELDKSISSLLTSKPTGNIKKSLSEVKDSIKEITDQAKETIDKFHEMKVAEIQLKFSGMEEGAQKQKAILTAMMQENIRYSADLNDLNKKASTQYADTTIAEYNRLTGVLNKLANDRVGVEKEEIGKILLEQQKLLTSYMDTQKSRVDDHKTKIAELIIEERKLAQSLLDIDKTLKASKAELKALETETIAGKSNSIKMLESEANAASLMSEAVAAKVAGDATKARELVAEAKAESQTLKGMAKQQYDEAMQKAKSAADKEKSILSQLEDFKHQNMARDITEEDRYRNDKQQKELSAAQEEKSAAESTAAAAKSKWDEYNKGAIEAQKLSQSLIESERQAIADRHKAVVEMHLKENEALKALTEEMKKVSDVFTSLTKEQKAKIIFESVGFTDLEAQIAALEKKTQELSSTPVNFDVKITGSEAELAKVTEQLKAAGVAFAQVGQNLVFTVKDVNLKEAQSQVDKFVTDNKDLKVSILPVVVKGEVDNILNAIAGNPVAIQVKLSGAGVTQVTEDLQRMKASFLRIGDELIFNVRGVNTADAQAKLKAFMDEHKDLPLSIAVDSKSVMSIGDAIKAAGKNAMDDVKAYGDAQTINVKVNTDTNPFDTWVAKQGIKDVKISPELAAYNSWLNERDIKRVKIVEEKNTGGLVGAVRAFSFGGKVPGVGSTDTVPAMLTPGEFVIKQEAVSVIGLRLLSMLNNMKSPSDMFDVFKGFSGGGVVSGPTAMRNITSTGNTGGDQITLNLQLGNTVIKTTTDKKNVNVLKEYAQAIDSQRRRGYQQ